MSLQRDAFARAAGALSAVTPFDLAAFAEVDGDALRVRAAAGALADVRVTDHSVPLPAVPAVSAALAARAPRRLDAADHAAGRDPFRGVVALPDGHGCAVAPVVRGGDALGVLTIDRARVGALSDVELAAVAGFACALGEALAAARDRAAASADRDLALAREALAERASADAGHVPLDALPSPAMRALAARVRAVASTESSVLVAGEPGAGKAAVARALHRASYRAAAPFVAVRCAAVAPPDVHRALFGAGGGPLSAGSRVGAFDAAATGTLALFGVDRLPVGVQRRLARVVAARALRVDGGARIVAARIVATATAPNAMDAELRAAFGEPWTVPPLRERPEDVGPIASAALAALARSTGRGPWTLSAAAAAELARRPWPGNLRELVAAVVAAAAGAPAGELPAAAFGGGRATAGAPGEVEPAGGAARVAPFSPRRLADVEREHIARTLAFTGGKIYGPGGAGELLGLKPSTLQSRMAKHGLKRR
ncbi:MAG: sigma-54-dependent Fis family transcriptional regulator [Deltaproteobacteria bacterium]|nr:MAG: sigma-54-dependent Fis family transcriptional regulator [Deltaproteobacteria bacterium]